MEPDEIAEALEELVYSRVEAAADAGAVEDAIFYQHTGCEVQGNVLFIYTGGASFKVTVEKVQT
jgi:putative N-acetylmannosamine-6-phosphate epimerase